MFTFIKKIYTDSKSIFCLAVQFAKSDIPLKYDLTSLKVISSGAAPLGSEHIEALTARINAYVRQG